MIEVRTAPAPVETVTPIRPSEAIRLGCLVAPVQMFGRTRDWGSDPQKACAVGAMALGSGHGGGGGDAFRAFDRLRDMTPETCPIDPAHHYDAEDSDQCVGWSQFAGPTAIAHLNDDHRWTREAIADWLESLGL